MNNFLHSLKGGLLLLVFICGFSCIRTLGQVTVDEYPGIPLIIYNNLRPESMDSIHYNQMQDMGVYGVLATDVQFGSTGNGRLELYEEHGLKVLPYQVWRTPNDIFKYTDSHYSVWEAEGTAYVDTTNGKATLYHSEHTTVDTVGGTISVKTNTGVTAGETLIYGPGYTQDAVYRFATAILDTIVDYTIEYNMKIKQTGNLLPGYLEDVVCTLLVTNIASDDAAATEDTVRFKEVKVSEFNGWDNWAVIDTTYDLIAYQSSPEFGAGMNQPDTDWQPSAYFVQFKVIWEGLDYLDLYIDKIRVYDDNGLGIVTEPDIQSRIANQVSPYISDTTIIGWYALDEPITIDNYEPFRVVNNIIDSVSNGSRQLWAGISRTWLGKYGYSLGMTHELFPPLEFWLRTKIENVHLNAYMYHSPWNGIAGDPAYKSNYKELNVNCVANLNLARLNDFDKSFAYSTQSGGWYRLDDNCDEYATAIIPSSSQINYHTNLGLLFGAKELWLDPFFSTLKYDSDCEKYFYSSKGLIDENNDTTANYNFFRFTLVPRLNGLFGKTLKYSQQTYQQIGYDALEPSAISSTSKFSSIVSTGGGQSPAYSAIIEFGFFDDHFGDYPDTEKDYFMLVNRYYNNIEDFTISLDDLTPYYNWNVKNYIDSTSFTVVPNGSGQASYNTTIDVGDAKFYSVLPVVKYGGELTANDTINSAVTLTDDMTINTGAELTITEGNTYTATEMVTLEGTGFITGSGYFDLTGNGEIVVSSWYRSLFKGMSNSHPELIWGEHPTIQNVESYNIYRKKETPNYVLIENVDDSVTQYIDTTVTIITGGEGSNETIAEYYVTAVSIVREHPSETSPSDTIEYARVEGNSQEKRGVAYSEQFTYKLAQNYPNPFNPVTSISYSIKNDGIVTIIIYDILGREVKTLVNENKPAGNYTANFDASALSSGVYLYKIKSGNFVDVKKMLLLK